MLVVILLLLFFRWLVGDAHHVYPIEDAKGVISEEGQLIQFKYFIEQSANIN
jgi:hypothetical protein